MPVELSGVSFREMYALVEEKVPFGRVAAPVLVTLLVVAISAGCVAFIFKSIAPIAATVGTVLPAFGRLNLSDPSWRLALSGVIFGATLLVASFVVVRMIRASERRLHESFDTNLRPRIEGLYASLAASDERILQLERRASSEAAMLLGDENVPAPDELTIHFARYGFGDRWADVTEALRRHVVAARRISLVVTNETLDCADGKDPYKGQRKDLEVTYSIGGISHSPVTVQEWRLLMLPTPKGPIRVRAKEMVFYGAARRRPGTEFTIKSPTEFSSKSMELLPE